MMSASCVDLSAEELSRLEVLGEGGSGVVYRLCPTGGGAPIALKVLRRELASSETERRRFVDEAARMRRVAHAGLVSLVGAGILADGRPYLAMRLVEGVTLRARIASGPLPVAEAIAHLGVLAGAVHALHEAGMVHRDIKPENIVLVERGERVAPVLLDFGIARDIGADASTTTASGRVRGTPAYMAPERFFGAPATIASDVYELGVAFYMMLVGKLPWGEERDATERLAPKSPEDVARGISRELALVVLRALSTRPEARPATVDAFAQEVERAFRAPSSPLLARVTEDVAATPAPRTEAPRSKPGRGRRFVTAALAFAFAFVSLGVVFVRGPAARPTAGLSQPLAAASLASAPAAPAVEPTVATSASASAARQAPWAPARRRRAVPSSTASSLVVDDDRYFEDRK